MLISEGLIEGSGEGLVRPFESIPIDFDEQSGADWYRIILTATLGNGNKPIHGFDSTPSSELLVRQDEPFASEHAVGRVRMNSAERMIPPMGNHVTERPYAGKDYNGVSSGSSEGASFAAWEPSLRKRAREASILAASIANHTKDKDGACYIVSKITGMTVEEVAAGIAAMPASHMNSEIVGRQRTHHQVLTCGTIQRAIVWDDTQLLNSKFPDGAAIDWGRVEAVARTIAEGNLQLDPTFEAYAKGAGVPFSLARGSCAHVSDSDYALDPRSFSSVPEIDFGRYKIPALKDAYHDSSENMPKKRARDILGYTELDMQGREVVVQEVLASKISRLDSLLDDEEDVVVSPEYRSVLATYDNDATANAHAKANGYGSFADAFAHIGIIARYDLNSKYTTEALMAMKKEAPDRDDGTFLA